MTDRRNVRWECACGAWSTHMCPEPNPTTTDILDQAHAALDGTTEGPWEWDEGKVPSVRQIRDERANVCETWTEADARFIAWARTGVPALIAEVEQLRAEVVQAWAACENNGKLADELWSQIGAGVALADQLDREATAPGQYAEIRRTHAARIRAALDGGGDR